MRRDSILQEVEREKGVVYVAMRVIVFVVYVNIEFVS